jgi:ATP-binding cassette subfamily B protein
LTKREFALEHEYHYDRSGPVRWIASHTLRYPVFPLAMLLASMLNNAFYSSIQVFIGRGFDLITTPGWSTAALLTLALGVMGAALGRA